MRLLIMGPPGAGKGTQAILIKNFYKIPHISTGEMFRKAISKNNALGLLAKKYIDKGELVPDGVTIILVKERLREEDCNNGFLLDGFPRTIAQAKALDEILDNLKTKIDWVINLVVDDDTLIIRIVGRRICKNCGATYHIENNKPLQENICDNCGSELHQRYDDIEETVVNRIKVYHNQTKPLLEYYQAKDLIKNINGIGSIEDIFKEVQKILGGINDIN